MKQVLRTTLVAAAVFPISLLVSGCFGGGGGDGDNNPPPAQTTETAVKAAPADVDADGKLVTAVDLGKSTLSLASLAGASIDVAEFPQGTIFKDADGNAIKADGDLSATFDVAPNSKDFGGISGQNYVGLVTKIALKLGTTNVASLSAPFKANVCLPSSSEIKANEQIFAYLVSNAAPALQPGSAVLDANKCTDVTIDTTGATAITLKTKLPATVIFGRPQGATGATGGGN